MVRRGSDPTVAADAANILQLHEAANSAVNAAEVKTLNTTSLHG